MKTYEIGNGALEIPRIGLGCMRINGLSRGDARALIETAMDRGMNFFDHADIYGGGEAESFFAEAIGMNPSVRDRMILQSKCGIRPGVAFDFSREWILSSVDGSLARLKTDYLDLLLLHRPDALMDPAEVAEAFDRLASSGKVRHFGVSNQNPFQMELLRKYVGADRLLVNQLQFSLMSCGMVDAGLNVNMTVDAGIVRDGSVLDWCRLNDVRIQAWSPFQFGFFGGAFVGNSKFPEVNAALDGLGAKYGASATAIAIAWILRHPAGIQPIVGTTNRARLAEVCEADRIELTREEWYRLYMAGGKVLP